jgi:type II secretion system protein G
VTQRQARCGAGRLKLGFTLIELLMVVAIIAILASIALPNFLEAQVRAKVSRAKADMRTLSTGLESYRVDNNGYPDIFMRLLVITTPVQYLTSLPRDIFRVQLATGPTFGQSRIYRYGAMPIDAASRYAIDSVGPDTDIDTYLDANAEDESSAAWNPDRDALRLYPGYSDDLFGDGVIVNAAAYKYILYDPTNGTVSNGDIFRLSDHQLP